MVGPLDGTCGANSAVQINIPQGTDYGKLQFQSTMTDFPTGLTLGGLGNGWASANVVLNTGNDQPYFLLPFVDSTGSLGQGSPSDQILLIEFQPSALSGNTLALDPNATLFNLNDNTGGGYLQGGQQVTHTLNGWLSLFPALSTAQLQGVWIGVGLAGNSSGADSITVNSLTITPLPAALPLVISGLGGMGLLGWRRKRKAATPRWPDLTTGSDFGKTALEAVFLFVESASPPGTSTPGASPPQSRRPSPELARDHPAQDGDRRRMNVLVHAAIARTPMSTARQDKEI